MIVFEKALDWEHGMGIMFLTPDTQKDCSMERKQYIFRHSMGLLH